MFSKQTVRDIDLKGKTVLLRADYNVPLEDGKITDDYRIKQSLPTLEYLLDQSAKVIICSHLGRPDGPNDSANSLFPVAKRLQQLLDRRVAFAPDCVGETAKKAVAGLKKTGADPFHALEMERREIRHDAPEGPVGGMGSPRTSSRRRAAFPDRYRAASPTSELRMRMASSTG